jgi:hypothetical protein
MEIGSTLLKLSDMLSQCQKTSVSMICFERAERKVGSGTVEYGSNSTIREHYAICPTIQKLRYL